MAMGLIHIYTSNPRSLNYLRSGVQDWTTKNVHHKGNKSPLLR
jgi:hypothetical protein